MPLTEPPLRLVIVDDEPAIVSGLCDLFPWADMGYRVAASFHDGESCLKHLRTHPADVLLTDIRMPGMGGVALAEAVARASPRVKIVFLSAHTDFEYVRQAMRCGVRAYLEKPVRYPDLIDTFTRLRAEWPRETDEPEDAAEPYRGYYAEIIGRLERYIEAQPDTATLEGAAACVGLTPGYVSRLFRRHTGATFSERLAERRMALAARLLSDPAVSVREAAYRAGYDNLRNFARAFAQREGVTPLTYRRRAIAGREDR